MADPLVVGTTKEIPKSLSAVAVDLSKAVTVPLLTTFQIPCFRALYIDFLLSR